MNEELALILAEVRQHLENIYDESLYQVVLFGSQSRNDASPDSDIDVLIVLKDNFNYFQESKRISVLIADLSLKHNAVISCVFTTMKDFQHKNSGFFRNVRREGVVL